MEENRPDFRDIKSFEEFNRYYWYREELSQICKRKTCRTLRHFCITDFDLRFFIQKMRIFDADMTILSVFQISSQVTYR